MLLLQEEEDPCIWWNDFFQFEFLDGFLPSSKAQDMSSENEPQAPIPPAAKEKHKKERRVSLKKRFTLTKGHNKAMPKFRHLPKKVQQHINWAVKDKTLHRSHWLMVKSSNGTRRYPKKFEAAMKKTGLFADELRYYMHNNARKGKRLAATMDSK